MSGGEFAILSLGQQGNYGANSGSTDNTNAFQQFMNSNTSGTANMVMLKSFTSLTDQLLNQYDLVILQALADSVYTDTGLWKFQQSDVDALNKWVTERGGAIVAMSGYGGYTILPIGTVADPSKRFESCSFISWLRAARSRSTTLKNWPSTSKRRPLFYEEHAQPIGCGCVLGRVCTRCTVSLRALKPFAAAPRPATLSRPQIDRRGDMHKIDRRTFMKAGLAIGAVGVVESAGIGRTLAAKPDIVAVQGADAFASTIKALDALGGIKRFVTKGNRVGLLINAPPHWKLEGSHARMEVALAVAKMCLDAGAKEIVTLPVLGSKFWTGSPLCETHAKVIKSLKECSGKTVETKIPKGVVLKSGKVRPELLDVDVLVNLPIAKHHVGTMFSGNLKNMMGGLDRETNAFFHAGSGKSGYEDVDFLSQCIAELNTLRRQDLCIADATVVLGTNGPAGPGDLLKPQKVVAGTDPVAVDAYCVTLHSRKPKEVVMLAKAAAAGVGRADFQKLNLQEIAI